MTPDTTAHDFRPLDANHNRAAFSCGDIALDGYFRRLARQSVDKRLAVVHVMSNTDTGDVIGYYTLTNTSINAGELPAELVQKKRYRPSQLIGATLLGRFAVDVRYSGGNGWGVRMYMDASHNAMVASKISSSCGVLLDVENPAARAFWVRREFVPLGVREDGRERFFMPMEYIERLHGSP
jgi:hypothetical protein